MKYELAQAKKKLLEKKGREKLKEASQQGHEKRWGLSTIDKGQNTIVTPPPKPKETTPHNTRAIFINQ